VVKVFVEDRTDILYIEYLLPFLGLFTNRDYVFIDGVGEAKFVHDVRIPVRDVSDGKLAHLDGLNFSRAWCLFEMGKALNNQKMTDLAIEHFNYSYNKMDSGEYAGAHWLASFAVYALKASPNPYKGEK